MSMLAAAAAVNGEAAIIGVFVVGLTHENRTEKDPHPLMHRAMWITNALVVTATIGLKFWLNLPWGVCWTVVAGFAVGRIIGWGTEFYTAAE